MNYCRNYVFFIAAVLLLFASPFSFSEVKTSWTAYSQEKHDIHIPDLPGYITLKCDFHMHTVFSDGTVWPTVRVDEAWREGLDAIAISDHIEYQPHKDYIPTNHEASNDIAAPYAKTKNILLPRAVEITQDTPPGHFNALFLTDNAALDTKDVLDQARIANEQGAFLFWDHPGWKGLELGRWMETHSAMYEKKWLHGIEICNGDTLYPEAFQWAVEKNLTMIGNSDMHEPILDKPRTPENHRTITLVFAQDKTLPALKEALFAGRTVVWSMNRLFGQEKYLKPLFDASVKMSNPYLWDKKSIWVQVDNSSDIAFELEKTGTYGPQTLLIPANASIQLKAEIKKEEFDPDVKEIRLSYIVKNLLTAPEKPLPVEFVISMP
ncbi:MAG: Sb-PDE family phosphodiesterase [Candidatus Omnitrophota bacterium]